MDDLVPSEFYLFRNYPNPFKDKTTIKYCVAYNTKVRITVYNSEGKMIDKLVDEVKEAGTYEVKFSLSGREKSVYSVSSVENHLSGIDYPLSIPLFYRMKAGNYISEKKMILIKKENTSVQSK